MNTKEFLQAITPIIAEQAKIALIAIRKDVRVGARTVTQEMRELAKDFLFSSDMSPNDELPIQIFVQSLFAVVGAKLKSSEPELYASFLSQLRINRVDADAVESLVSLTLKAVKEE
jgi:hypothetical protein